MIRTEGGSTFGFRFEGRRGRRGMEREVGHGPTIGAPGARARGTEHEGAGSSGSRQKRTLLTTRWPSSSRLSSSWVDGVSV
jgi:hypothetical protein